LHVQQLPGSSLPAQYAPPVEHIVLLGNVKQRHPAPVVGLHGVESRGTHVPGMRPAQVVAMPA
jgi:hypothetical protein